MVPTLYEVLQKLERPVHGSRFKHCGSSTLDTNASIFGDDEFYCHACGTRGGWETLINSYFEDEIQSNAWAQYHFPDLNSLRTITPLQRNLTSFVKTCHQTLLMDHPTTAQCRQFLKDKWGLELDDIYRFHIGVAFTSTLECLSVEQTQMLQEQGMFDRGEFHLDYCLIFPDFKDGFCHYYQARAIKPDASQKHIKPRGLEAGVFGAHDAARTLTKTEVALPLVLVEGICDAYTFRRMGYPAVALLSANTGDRVGEALAPLVRKASATILEFDSDKDTQAGQKGAERLAKKLIRYGIDPCVTLTAVETYHPLTLPAELSLLPKLDISELAKRVGLETLRTLTHHKFTRILTPEDNPSQPASYLRFLIQQAKSPNAIEEVYTLVSGMPVITQTPYIALMAKCFGHNAGEIKKQLQARKPKKKINSDMEIVTEGNEFKPWTKASQDYVIDTTTNTLYSTKSGFLNCRATLEDGTEYTQKMLAILTAKSQVSFDKVLTELESIELIDPDKSEYVNRRDSPIPLEDLAFGKPYPYWANPLSQGLIDPYCLSQLRLSFSKTVASIDPVSLYESVYRSFKDTVYFTEEIYYHICTLYVFMTYVYRLFDAVPYLHFQGVSGSGKSTALKVLQDLCFKALATVNATPPALYSMVHSHGCTMIFDEEDTKSNESKLSDREKDLKSLLNQGYSRIGGGAMRTENIQGILKTVCFDVYSPKIFAGTKGFYTTLANRCILINTRPANLEERNLISYRPYSETQVETHLISNKLNAWSMGAGLSVHRHNMFLRRERDFSEIAGNRYSDLFAPLLAVLRTVGDPYKIEKDLIQYMTTYKESRIALERGMPDTRLSETVYAWINSLDKLTPEQRFKLGVTTYAPNDYILVEKRMFAKNINDFYLKLHGEMQESNSANALGLRLNRLGVASRTTLGGASEVALLEKTIPFKPYRGVRGPRYEFLRVDTSLIAEGLMTLETTSTITEIKDYNPTKGDATA